MLHIDDVQPEKRGPLTLGAYFWVLTQRSPQLTCPGQSGFKVIGRTEVSEGPKLEFRVHLMDLTSDDKHNMQLNHKHVPNPVVSARRSGVFRLPLGHRIVYVSNILDFAPSTYS